MNATEIKELTEAAGKLAADVFNQAILLVSDPKEREVLQKFRQTYILIKQANAVAAHALPAGAECDQIMHYTGNASANVMAIIQLANKAKK